jgi:hypothetical protein
MVYLSTPVGQFYLIDTLEKFNDLRLYTDNTTFHVKNGEVVVNFQKTQIVLKNQDETFKLNLGTIGKVSIIGYYPTIPYSNAIEKVAHYKKLTLTESTIILKQDVREYPFIRSTKTKNT